MYLGEFLNEGTTEIEQGNPKIYLVCSETGTRRDHTRYFRVVLIDANGSLVKTSIHTDDSDSGWALRIRTDIEKLLKETSDAFCPVCGQHSAYTSHGIDGKDHLVCPTCGIVG